MHGEFLLGLYRCIHNATRMITVGNPPSRSLREWQKRSVPLPERIIAFQPVSAEGTSELLCGMRMRLWVCGQINRARVRRTAKAKTALMP